MGKCHLCFVGLRLKVIVTQPQYSCAKMSSDEKLNVQWNDFRENLSSALGDLREDKEFTDVTLVCEDGQQVEAHKVVLVASSPH